MHWLPPSFRTGLRVPRRLRRGSGVFLMPGFSNGDFFQGVAVLIGGAVGWFCTSGARDEATECGAGG